MSKTRVELAEMVLPEFGLPGVEPTIPAATYEARISAARQRASDAGYDVLIVYADREHFANLAYLTGFDPRFEEALLILTQDRIPTLLVGNEDMAYTSISPIELQPVLYQTFSLLSQPRSSSAPLTSILRDAGIGSTEGKRIGIAGWKYFTPIETAMPDAWLEVPAYLVDTLRAMGCEVHNAGQIFMEPEHGLRVVNDVDQLASFEFAATYGSQGLRDLLFNIRPGMSEFEAFQLMSPIGLPLCYHPVVFSGERTALGLASPSSSLSERTKQRPRQSLQRRPPITVETGATRRSTIADRTPLVMIGHLGCTHAVALALRPEDGMEALQIESQTDQTPLASGRSFPAQGELAEA